MTHLEDTAPAAPPARPRAERGGLQRVYAFLTSPKLALALLVTILACCLVGVTVLRGEQAWRLVFSTLWFNALLALLAVSSAAAFFTRIWRRKLTVVQVGMIVFHVSFAMLLGGVVYNSLFYFDGILRLTEGETLSLGAVESYDGAEAGRLFGLHRLRGEATLHRMVTNLVVDGQNKRVGYEIEVGEPGRIASGTVYVNRNLAHDGIRYFCLKEGYSILVVMSDPRGRELYGAYVPLQSLQREDGSRFYATGTAQEVMGFPFPAAPEKPLLDLAVTFRPSSVSERQGEVGFMVAPPRTSGTADAWKTAGLDRGKERHGEVQVGAEFDAGDYRLQPREVRYWAALNVRHDPGLNVILGSMCSGLAGMVITLFGRVRQGTPRRPVS